MKKQFQLLLIITLLGNFCIGQNQSTKPISASINNKLDTVTTLCLVLTNVQVGQSQTMWVTKVHGAIYDFQQPTDNELRKDSLTLKKKLIQIKRYFAQINSEVVDPKTKKKTIKPVTQEIPESYILIDFNNNLTPAKHG